MLLFNKDNVKYFQEGVFHSETSQCTYTKYTHYWSTAHPIKLVD